MTEFFNGGTGGTDSDHTDGGAAHLWLVPGLIIEEETQTLTKPTWLQLYAANYRHLCQN